MPNLFLLYVIQFEQSSQPIPLLRMATFFFFFFFIIFSPTDGKLALPEKSFWKWEAVL